MTGEIIEEYPNDYPYPSCLICGKSKQGKTLHIVLSNEGTMCRLITAYFPNINIFSSDYKTRRK